MFWCAVYVGVAIVVAIAAFVIANFFRSDDVVAPDHPGTLSVVAGALWPVIVIGMTELAVTIWLMPGRQVR